MLPQQFPTLYIAPSSPDEWGFLAQSCTVQHLLWAVSYRTVSALVTCALYHTWVSCTVIPWGQRSEAAEEHLCATNWPSGQSPGAEGDEKGIYISRGWFRTGRKGSGFVEGSTRSWEQRQKVGNKGGGSETTAEGQKMKVEGRKTRRRFGK